MIIVIKNQLKELNQQYKKSLVKTLLALLLLIPSFSWGIGKSPLEKCMDRVIDGTYDGNEKLAAAAAKVCTGNK